MFEKGKVYGSADNLKTNSNSIFSSGKVYGGTFDSDEVLREGFENIKNTVFNNPQKSFKQVLNGNPIPSVNPTKGLLEAQPVITLSDRVNMSNVPMKLEAGEDLTASERNTISKYGLNTMLTGSVTSAFDISSQNNPKNVARFNRVKEIVNKKNTGVELSEDENNTLETFKLLNEYNKNNAKSNAVMTGDVNDNAQKLQMTKAAQIYNDTAYVSDKIKVGNKEFQADKSDPVQDTYTKWQREKNRLDLYMKTGLSQYAEGINTTFDVIFGKEPEDIANEPDSAYSIASYALKEYYNARGEKFNSTVQDVVTNIANNAPGMVAGMLAGGLGLPSAAASAIGTSVFGISVFGNSYKEGAQLGVTDKGRLLVYALASTASECALEYAIGGIPGVGGALSGELISNFSKSVSSALGKAVIKVVGSGAGEFIEESMQSLLSPLLQKYILSANVETVFDNPIDSLSSAAYEGFIGLLTSVLMGGLGNVSEAFNEASIQSSGKYYNNAFKESKTDVKNIAKYFTEVSEKKSELAKSAQKVIEGDTSDFAVGDMMFKAVSEMWQDKKAFLKKVGETVKNSDGGIEAVIKSYESVVDEGGIFPDKVKKLYDTAKSTENISDEDIGELALSVQIYAPRAEIIGGLLEKADSADEVNLDSETGAEYNYDRGDDNGVYHDGRTAQNERELEEAGYEDAGGNSENERAWGESEEAFAARAQRNANKTGRGKRVLLKHGSGSLAYTEKSADNTEASRATEWLKRAGVNAVYCDGDIETNQNGVTTIHREAMTAPDGTVYISSRATLSYLDIVSHEIVHFEERKGTQAYTEYENIICENLLFNSQAYKDFCAWINEKHYGGKYNIEDVSSANNFIREIAAYVNEFTITEPSRVDSVFSDMFNDWGEVKAAAEKFNRDTGADFSESVSFSSKNDVQSDKNKGYNSGTEYQMPTNTDVEKAAYDYCEKNIDEIKHDFTLGDNFKIKNIFAGGRSGFVRILSNGEYESGTYGLGTGIVKNENVIRTNSLEEAIFAQYKYMLENSGDEGQRMIRKHSEMYKKAHQTITTKIEKTNIQADKADTKSDSYAKDKSFWTAENSNEKSEKTGTLVSKLKALFGNEKGDSTVSVGEIVKLIEKDFGIPVSKGKFRERAYGIYKVKAEAIRTKISNALPTIGHELGHHLDKKYNLRNFQSINEAMRVLKDARPNFYNSYPPEARPGEAVAEFIRNYLADRTLAKRSYPFFYEEFERVLSEKGTEDLKNLKTIGDKINEYFTAEKADRARAAVISREEARKRNAADKEVADYLEAFETNFVDEAAPLKKISKKAYDLFYYAKKADVRARSAIVGDGVASFDGENGGLAYMRDGDGNIIKDSDGKPLNMQPLQKVLAEIDNKSKPDFEMYLVYKHGLEFLENDKRVFADDSINDKEFISKEIKRLEKAYPQFKKTAEELYSWYKSFIYEYGVKSGLLSKEQYKALNEKYPCYVPFNRNVSDGKNGVKKSVANQKAPIMRAKGSGLEILSPLESITQKVAQFMNAADRNAVMQDIANKADNVEGLGYLLEQVPPDMMPVTVSTESIKKGINEWYKEQSENGNLPDDFTDTIDEIIGDTVTQFVQSNNQGRNVVWVYRKGKKTLYQVHDPNLLTALTGLNKPQFGAFTRAVGNITRLFKVLTTGGNFVWSITSNTPRDFDAAYKYSIEKNPIKFTVDYVRAVISAFSQFRGDKASDIVKLYKTVGGGYNNSFIYNSKELKTTMSELIKKDESYLKHFISRFNLIEAIEQLADFIETAPRLAEFKRVYEQTGDTQKALLAAEEITVNFNRSGSKSKVIDQYIPYFNAGIQGVNKLVSTALDSEKNKAFFAKTVVSGVITVGLLFAWNMLAMGDDDNDEYEKLSAYKKNNFYNFYIGNGKFFSIPKSKDTAVFDSTLERVFEIALKEDVDYSQEIKDYLSYLWLVFAPPLPTDAIILSTAKDLWRNEDFKGTPIVSSYYEKLEPKEQYNEKTTYIAKALGQLTGYSPMKIDHIINSNLGILGLLNKSYGKKDIDWFAGLGTKLITDNAYSTDILNRFYDNADKYEKEANSYPDNAEAVYKNKQYSAAKSVISALNKYGKENPDNAREIKILSRDYADNFEKNSGVDKKLLGLLERTGDKDILYDKTFSREYSIDKVKYTMDLEDYLDYVDEYYDEIEKEYDRILTMNVSDEYTAEMLKNAKEEVSDELADKYKVVK